MSGASPRRATILLPMTLTSEATGADAEPLAAFASESNAELVAGLDEDFRLVAAAQGRITARLGEVNRREAFREQGATSTQSWAAERFGVARSTARTLTHVGEKAWDLPHLMGAVCAGTVSLDKLKAVADVATAESDEELCAQAQRCTVPELAEVARADAARRGTAAQELTSAQQHERRFVRFNDTCRTMTAQFPAESYAEAKACLEARAKAVPSDGETPWDQRMCDGLTGLLRSSVSVDSDQGATTSPFFVVVHVPLEALVDKAGDVDGDSDSYADGDGRSTQLAGELERDGLLSVEVVRKIACDATIAVAVDDDVGHTMYEGRARRFPTTAQRREVRRRDRHCRFPGCTNVTFANVHHIVPWKPGGRTDLPNLALLCQYHHHLVHSKGWSMTGDANEELRIVGPTGHVMESRPSPLWGSFPHDGSGTAG
jgi:hypothetical protein